jgi:hypothetical protein
MLPNIDKQKWLANYRETHEMLERMRPRERVAMKDEGAWRQIQSLIAVEPWRERPDWSGLVEQQAIFHRKKR